MGQNIIGKASGAPDVKNSDISLGLTALAAPELRSMDESAIHLAVLNLDDGDLAHAGRLLSPTEHQRASQLRRQADRERYIRGRGALREAIGKALGMNPVSVPMLRQQRGKPVLPDEFELGFSVAHCRTRGVIVLGRRRALGIDVERLRDIDNRDALVARHFSPNERRAMSGAPGADQQRLFFQCWTRKEAFLKMSGRGLGTDLAQHDVGLGNDAPQGVNASLHTFELEPGTIVSIASDRAWSTIHRIS